MNKLKTFGIIVAYLATVLVLALYCTYLLSTQIYQDLGWGTVAIFALIIVVVSTKVGYASPFWRLIEDKGNRRHMPPATPLPH